MQFCSRFTLVKKSNLRSIATFLGLALFTVGCSSIPTKPRPLLSPYDDSNYAPGPGVDQHSFDHCPTPPKPIQNLDLQDIYSDPPTYSKVDPKLEAEFNAKKKLLVDYSKMVWRAANSFQFTGNKKAAHCALTLLKDWATASAMLGNLSKNPNDKSARFQGLITREWILGQLANSYLKVRSARNLKAKDKEIVLSWFRKLAVASPKFFADYPGLLENNLMTWAGSTSIITAIALNDRKLFDFSIETFKRTVNQIQDDGTLPKEMVRKEQALHYHNFTLTPLTIIAYFAEANKVDIWTYSDSRINKLVELLTGALLEPDIFSKRNGIKPNLEYIGDDAGWTELVYRRFHDPRLKAYLTAHRPIQEYWFDWNVTSNFGETLAH